MQLLNFVKLRSLHKKDKEQDTVTDTRQRRAL